MVMQSYVTNLESENKTYRTFKRIPYGAPFAQGSYYIRRVNFTASVHSNGVKTNGQYVKPTNFSYFKTKVWEPVGTYSYYNMTDPVDQGYRRVGTLADSFSLRYNTGIEDRSSAVYAACVKKLYDKIRNADTNLAIDLFERRQTARMLSNSFEAIPKVVGWARKARTHYDPKRMSVEQGTKAIGNAWLSYTYGWKPLLSTIYGLSQFVRSTYQTREVKARSGTTSTSKSKSSNPLQAPWAHQDVRSQRWEIGATFQITEPALYDLTRLTTLNPLAIAWELVPYSFVVDWFLDIGGYLQAWEQSLMMGLQFQHGYKSYSEKFETTGSYQGVWTPSGFTRGPYDINAPWKRVFTQHSRSKLTSMPKVPTPRLDVRLGWQRMTSAAALLQQILVPDTKLSKPHYRVR